MKGDAKILGGGIMGENMIRDVWGEMTVMTRNISVRLLREASLISSERL